MPTTVTVHINQQQKQLLEQLVRERSYGATPAEVIRNVFRAFVDRPSVHADVEPGRPVAKPHVPREVVFEHLIEPGTGKAVPVLRGQILRIAQVAGGQCADFNAFNLHDYKEYWHAGRTRNLQGLFPTTGDVLWSNPPRDRPMYTIIADTAGTNDVNYARCSGFLYEYQFGFLLHTNCADIQAEAQREYGLTPDDVHDSFNFWMHVGISPTDGLEIRNTVATADDYVELIAHFDTLAIPNVCGDDVYNTSGFELKPLELQVLEATDDEKLHWLLPEARQYRNQRTPADFKVQAIKPTRELTRDPSYKPEWGVYPIEQHTIDIELSDDECASVQRLRDRSTFGVADAEIVRAAFFTWWLENRTTGPKHAASRC